MVDKRGLKEELAGSEAAGEDWGEQMTQQESPGQEGDDGYR